MPWHAQIVMGPAGSGKSTYCEAVQKHCAACRRTAKVVNLDPAAEHFNYEVAIDIRELITLEEVMESEELGPNGGLIFAMEYLVSPDGMEWLEEELGQFEDSYLLFDCPGQIELYSHVPVMRQLVDSLQTLGCMIAGVYLLDAQFCQDPSKFIAGTLSSQSCMMQLELPHVNVLTKLDLMDKGSRDNLDSFLNMDVETFVGSLQTENGGHFHEHFAGINNAIAQLIGEFSLVSFIPLDSTDEESLEVLMYAVDSCIQYGEDKDPNETVEPGERDECDGVDNY